MKDGSKVLYQGEQWEVIFVYANGYYEIRKCEFMNQKIELVSQSEITEVQ